MELFNTFPITIRLVLDVGKVGVALFFLMTGFLCNRSLERQTPGKFLANKVLRIYPVYIVGFSITFLFIYMYNYTGGRGFPYNFSNWLIQVSLFREWFWMPNIDGLSWTLEAQLKFYILIAIIALFKKQKSAKFVSLVSGLLAFAAVLLSGNLDKMYNAGMTFWWRFSNGSLLAILCLTYMLLGTAFYQHHIGLWSTGKLFAVIVVLYTFFIFACLAYAPNALEIILNYTYGLVIFSSTYTLSRNGGSSVFQWKVVRFLAKISYPLYVVHGLVGFIIMTYLYNMGWSAFACFLTAVFIVIVLACLLHIFIEVPCGKFANRLLFGNKKKTNEPGK